MMSRKQTPIQNEVPKPRWRITRVRVALLLLLAYVASGFYSVQPNERGVVQWLGWIPDSQGKMASGIHYALPWPFCRVDKPRTTEVRRVYVGFQPEDREGVAMGDLVAMAASSASDMLTGDVNILKITMVVQYQVTDPAAYLFATEDPDQVVRVTVQAVLIDELAALSVDRALTIAKSQLQDQVLSRSQSQLDAYGCGVNLVGATLESIEPPRAIIDAFKDVVSAKKDGEKMIDQAVSLSSTVTSQARGEAATFRQAAEAYRVAGVSRARGEADRFVSLLAEYRKAPQVTRDRLRLETFARVLPQVKTYLLDNKEGGKPANIRIISAGQE